jgi:hypothetical protein
MTRRVGGLTSPQRRLQGGGQRGIAADQVFPCQFDTTPVAFLGELEGRQGFDQKPAIPLVSD